MPRALMMEKIKSDKLFTMVSGSLPPAEGRDAQRRAEGQRQNSGEVETAGPLPELLAGGGIMGTAGKVLFHIQDSSVSSKISMSSRDVKVKSRSSAP